MDHHSQTDREAGFTLIELSVVLLVIGLILGVSITAWLSMRTSQQFIKAEAQLERAEACLLEGVITSGKIPPPAWFQQNCQVVNPWGYPLEYSNSCTVASRGCAVRSQSAPPFAEATPRSFTEYSAVGTPTTSPDAVWIVHSKVREPQGDDLADRSRLGHSSPEWVCDNRNTLCQTISRNRLYYETH